MSNNQAIDIMENGEYGDISPDIIRVIGEQSEDYQGNNGVNSCSEEQRLECAMTYGPQAVDNKILISISQTVNDMAKAISASEIQKSTARKSYMIFFQWILVVALLFVGSLVIFNGLGFISISKEIFISVIVVIIADIVAIVHSFVKYINSLDHYKVYNNLIDSLLSHLRNNPRSNNSE